MEFIDFFHNAWIIAIGIIGFFLKALHDDLKEVIKDTQNNKQKIQLLSMDSDNKLDKLKETTEMQIQALTKSVDELTKNVSDINKSVLHMNGNIKTGHEYFLKIIEELQKK